MEGERDYLKEAYEIAEGKSSLLPQVEHLNALVEHLKYVTAEGEMKIMEEKMVTICPVCGGKGIVPHDFYNVDRTSISSTSLPEYCRACFGRGIIIEGKEEIPTPPKKDTLTSVKINGTSL